MYLSMEVGFKESMVFTMEGGFQSGPDYPQPIFALSGLRLPDGKGSLTCGGQSVSGKSRGGKNFPENTVYKV